MDSSEQLFTTFINCGHRKLETITLNDQSNIDEIHETVRLLCGSHLPTIYCLAFYNCESRKFVKLNQSHLSQDFHLFRLSSYNVVPFVDLYVIDTADELEILCDETSAINSNDTTREKVSEQDLPIIDTETDVNNTSILMPDVVTNNNEESLPEYGDEAQSYSHFSSNHTPLDHLNPDLSEALLTIAQPVQTLLVNTDYSGPIERGVAMPPRSNSLIPIQCQPSIELNEMQNIKSNRLYFSLDVKPEQRDVYRSDQFNQKNEEKINGYVARLQGIKRPEQKWSSVLPKIRIPISFRNKRNVRLVVYAVSEKIDDGIRIWSTHRDKGFLPKNYTRDSLPINPIEFDVNQNSLTMDGDLILDLPMTTWWNKLKETDKIYQLNEQSTIRLHLAEHDSLSPRLLCFLKDEHYWYEDTLCLSNFIRSKSPSKRNLPVSNSTVQTNTTACKRSRVK